MNTAQVFLEDEKTWIIRLYNHGAHTANISFKVDVWGMNSLQREAELSLLIKEAVTHQKVLDCKNY